MQLVAYGAQDIYLTGNPQITFFKVVYRRHTNFSMETISQTLNGSQTAVSANQTATCTISRNGDLVHKVYVTFATDAADTEGGSKLVKEVELEIGGQRIDRHYQEWNDVWNELSTPESKAIGLKSMQLDVGTGGGTGSGVTNAHIPLNFWFCRNPGLALPLIALQYHEVKLKFTWGALSGTPNPEVWCDYVYLDTDERRRFAQVSHEYLIEQLQKEDKTTTEAASNHKINFNHPVSAFVFLGLIGISNGFANVLGSSTWAEIYGVKYIGSIKALTTALMVFATAFGTALFGFLIDGGFSIEQIAIISAIYISISLISLFLIRNKLNPTKI